MDRADGERPARRADGPLPSSGSARAGVPVALPRGGTQADVHLRGASGRVRARVLWPARARSVPPPPLVVLLAGAPGPDEGGDGAAPGERRGRDLCTQLGVVVVAVAVDPMAVDPAAIDPVAVDAVALAVIAVGWAADHAADLAADPGRLIVVGEGVGAAVAAQVAARADDEGWPPIAGLVVVHADRPSAALVRAVRPHVERPAPEPIAPDPHAAAPPAPPSPRTTP